jgi:hypothetical protein
VVALPDLARDGSVFFSKPLQARVPVVIVGTTTTGGESDLWLGPGRGA